VSQKEITFPYRTYILGDVVFVPHYLKQMWVAPGYNCNQKGSAAKEYSEEELHKMKAKPSKEMLWPRKAHNILT